MRTLLAIVLALSLTAGVAQAQQNLCYGWEDGGTVLSAYLPGILYVANTGDQYYEGSRSLEIYKNADGGTPQAYVAWITNLQAGDQVTATVQTLDLITGNPSVRIWGHWTPVGGDVNSYSGSASGSATYSGGVDWTELGYTWTVPVERDGEGLIVEIRPYNASPWAGSNWIDYLCVIAPNHATIQFPSPATGLPPAITNVYHRSLLPQAGNPVTVSADVVDNDGTVASVTLHYQVNGGGETSTPMSLLAGDTYTATIPGGANGDFVEYYVSALDNDGLPSRNPATGYYSYTVGPEVIVPIGSLHDDYATYEGQVVKVQGQVYIPGDYRADGVSVAAYIQGADGRGLNVFGTIRSTGMDLLNDVDYIVKVSGTVGKYFTTLQLQNYEVELVSTGNPPLVPVVLSTGDAALPANEGSYIKASGPITAIATSSGTNPAHNFTIDDGTGPVVVRVDDDLEPDMPNWLVGEILQAAGAGGSFNQDGQIIVGLSSDLVKLQDTTRPTLVATLLTQPTSVRLQFSEPIDITTGEATANYAVYETANPGNTVAVVAAERQDDMSYIVLTLAASISGTEHSVAISDVEDLAGNLIDPNPTVAVIFEPDTQTVCYGWEDGGTVLGAFLPDQIHIENTDAQAYEGSYALAIYETEGSGTPAGFVAWIPAVVVGDEIYASIQTLDLVDGSNNWPQLRLWGEWTAPDGTVFDFVGSAGGNETYSGGTNEWKQLDWTWTVPADRDGYGLRIVIRVYNGTPWVGGNWVDHLCVTAPTGRTIILPSGGNAAPAVPVLTALKANYPNPFNPATTFSFSLERDARVELAVFDVRGRKVRTVVDAPLAAGDYDSYMWDGRDDQGRLATSGTYFYRLTTDDGYVQSRKMTLLK